MTRPTSRDVATAAGVSQATVSLVLGDKWPGRVSERTATHVRETATRLGYRPNLAARNLRLGTTRTALLVVPALTNEFFARVYTGAARVAAEHDFGVVLYPSPDGTGPARDPFASARAALDGVIASSMAADALDAIGGATLPSSCSTATPPPAPPPPTSTSPWPTACARSPNTSSPRPPPLPPPRLRHRHLDLPHPRRSPQSPPRPRHRAAHRTGPLTVEGARTAMETALATPQDRPTAIVCDDDILAAGACKAARRLGLRIPEDLSVTGFDDLALATAVEPELTTVHLPAERVGEQGMAALLAVLEGTTWTAPDIPVRLVVRDSTGPAPTPQP